MAGWAFWANRANGDGTESLVAADLPLSGVRIVDALSAPCTLAFTLTPEVMRLKDERGRPVLRAWSTIVYAELDGVIRGAGIVARTSASEHELSVECGGFPTYLDGLPWTNTTKTLYQADPAAVARMIWAYAQAHPQGNLGVRLVPDDLATPARVGVKTTGENATDEPVLLANYATADLGRTFVEMLEAGSIDYREVHRWDESAPSGVAHELVMGYPRLGRRRTDIAFQVGVNVAEIPDVEFDADDYASEILLLGAGEGDKMVRAHARLTDPGDRLRKVRVVAAKHIGRQASANAAAQSRAKLANVDGAEVEKLAVRDHPLAPLGSWEAGDEVHLSGEALWGGELDMWVRILSTEWSPDTPAAALSVIRADRI